MHLNALRHDEREARRAEAWALRLAGSTVRQIAEAMNVSVGTASQYLQETLAELQTDSRESADSWRQIQLDRLDAIVAAWLPISRNPTHPEATRAAAIVVRAVEGQSRLLGLLVPMSDAPVSPAQSAESIEDSLANSAALRESAGRLLARAMRGVKNVVAANQRPVT